MQQDLDILKNAICTHVLVDRNYDLSTEEKKQIAKFVDPNLIPQNSILDSSIAPYLNWSRFESKNISRIINSNPTIIEYLSDESKSKLSFKDIKRVFVIDPDKFYEFNFVHGQNLDNEDIFFLITNAHKSFLWDYTNEVKNLSHARQYEIMEEFSYNTDCVELFELNDFSAFHISNIIKYIDDSILHKLDLSKLTQKHWLDVLKSRPSTLPLCDIDMFNNCDPYYLVEFVCLFPEYHYLITEDVLKKIKSLGWERLLLTFPGEYDHQLEFMSNHDIVSLIINGCDISRVNKEKFSLQDWLRILEQRPDLIDQYNDTIQEATIMDIVNLIEMFPEKYYLFPVEKKSELTSVGWEKLLIASQDYFVDYCDFWKLTEVGWNNVLKICPNLDVHKF